MMRVLIAFVFLSVALLAEAKPAFKKADDGQLLAQLRNALSARSQASSGTSKIQGLLERLRSMQARQEKLRRLAQFRRGDGEGSDEEGEDYCKDVPVNDACSAIQDHEEFFKCAEEEFKKLDDFFAGFYEKYTGNKLFSAEEEELMVYVYEATNVSLVFKVAIGEAEGIVAEDRFRTQIDWEGVSADDMMELIGGCCTLEFLMHVVLERVSILGIER